MKNSILLILGIVLGVSITWVLKPTEAEAKTDVPTNSGVTIMDGSGGGVEFSTSSGGPSIDERPAALAPVLYQEQLGEYRTSLETRCFFFLI